MKLHEIVTKIETLESGFKVPWEVSRSGVKPNLFGSQICLSNDASADYLSLDEAKVVAVWLVEQLGGKVKWTK